MSKNSLKRISRYSVKDTGEMVIFGKRKVNRKDMRANIRAYGGRILLVFQSCGM
jgi:hypothetical protein